MEFDQNSKSGCLPRIRSAYKILTNAEQKVADYILESPGEVVHLSITELAEMTGNAEATIFRLCKKIGFKGYQSMKIALAGDIYSPMESVFEDVNAADNPLIIAQKVFSSITDSLRDTLKIINQDNLEQAIASLVSAPRVEVYGSGGSAVIAHDIAHRFMRFGIPVAAYADSHMQIASAALIKPETVVIAVSHTGSNKDLLDSVALAKENGATVIALTSHIKSPLTKVADITLCGSAKETTFRSEAMASRITHLAIVDVLYIGVFLRRQDEILGNIQKIREAIAQRRI
ncbi:MAG TPA: MurR/RpiR family transcriptional regulator [Candidatus Deferrimicrobium sp.]|nr:MurR/RpiR family transcriptional regulator [Candidatus Deferrimicrobium sp.]